MTPTVAAYVGLGANLGNPAQTVRDALQALRLLPDSAVGAVSSFYQSAPIDAGGDDFVNAVVRIDTRLEALVLLRALQAIELSFGRERPFRNAPRTLDLDLLLYGDSLIDEPDLEVPHPRMTSRAFVLLPLLELTPEIVIPGGGSARQFLPLVHAQDIRKMPAERG
jgi:2-amino-4-hydroxy-6-hydroxymethyldihydropteridine diphosphokinase